jgi:hypothetical protein
LARAEEGTILQQGAWLKSWWMPQKVCIPGARDFWAPKLQFSTQQNRCSWPRSQPQTPLSHPELCLRVDTGGVGHPCCPFWSHLPHGGGDRPPFSGSTHRGVGGELSQEVRAEGLSARYLCLFYAVVTDTTGRVLIMNRTLLPHSLEAEKVKVRRQHLARKWQGRARAKGAELSLF